MKIDYTKVIPPRFHHADYERDVPATLKEVFVSQLQKRDGLYLHGDPGVGKTHIACALAKEIIEKGYSVKFFNTGKFLETLRGEFDKPSNPEEVGFFKEIMDFKGVLILDDIGSEKVSDWARERIYLILNDRYENMLPTIFTSNCDLEILSVRIGDRVASRIAGMTVRVRRGGADRRYQV